MLDTCYVRSILDDSITNNLPLTEVFVETITYPKNISKVVLELNSLFPLPEFTHLKRVKSREVLLFPSKNIHNDEVHEILRQKGFQIDLLKNQIRRVKVAAVPPIIRAQYLSCHLAWPCNFHADKYIEKLYTNTVFTDQELKTISTLMNIAKEIGKISRISHKDTGVLIVDPKNNSVMAIGYDRSNEGPCRHAVMVAIDNVSKSQKGGTWSSDGYSCTIELNLNINGMPQDVLKLLKEKGSDIHFDNPLPLTNEPEEPYLCTGYYVFTTREPCIMCSMALIHSRAKRIFYAKSSDKGGLGTLCKLHTVKELNHHYEVFVVENRNEQKYM